MSEPPDEPPELAAARRDPRLSHGREAVIADWWAACDAAERARRLAEWGLEELRRSLEREERATGYRHGDELAPAGVQDRLRAAYERARLAEAEAANQMAELNAMTLVTLIGALDAMVETLAPSARRMHLELAAEHLMTRAEEQVWPAESEKPAALTDDLRARMSEAVGEMIDERLPRGENLGGVGASRWEGVLKGASLQAPRDRPIPSDMDEALQEVVALRHVIAHRASRVDEKALKAAPSLRGRYREGELVRLSRADYRQYAAALRTYADEVTRRLLGSLADDVELAAWRDNIPVNT